MATFLPASVAFAFVSAASALLFSPSVVRTSCCACASVISPSIKAVACSGIPLSTSLSAVPSVALASLAASAALLAMRAAPA